MTEPRSFELLEFVLLACDFNIVAPSIEDDEGEGATDDAGAGVDSGPPATGIEVDGARLNVLSIDIDEDADEFVFVPETTVTDPAALYELSVVTGSRFTVPEPSVTTTEAASTLLFISYPYVRELVFSLTSRSPFSGFQLPPLTKRPFWEQPDAAG